MTIGYPDDQAYANWQGALMVNTGQSFPTGFTNLGNNLIGNYASLFCACNAAADGIEVQFAFFTDSTFTNIVDTITVYTSAVCEARVTIPAITNYVQVGVDNNAAGAVTAFVFTTPTNIAVPCPTYYGYQNFIDQAITSVPLSTTSTFALPFVQPGIAWLYFEPQDATGKLAVEVTPAHLTPGGNNKVIHLAGPTTEVDRLLVLPDVPCILNVINTDGAAAHSFRGSLVPGGSTR